MRRLIAGLLLFFVVVPVALAVYALRLDLYLYPISRRILLHEGRGASHWVELVPSAIEPKRSLTGLRRTLSLVGFHEQTLEHPWPYKAELEAGKKVFRIEIGRISCSVNLDVIVSLDAAGTVLNAKGARNIGVCL